MYRTPLQAIGVTLRLLTFSFFLLLYTSILSLFLLLYTSILSLFLLLYTSILSLFLLLYTYNRPTHTAAYHSVVHQPPLACILTAY
jgi:hypothetical protein